MRTLQQKAFAVIVAVCLTLLPCSAFGDFEKNPIILSAKGTLADLKRLQTRCQVGITYSEYARALNDVQNEINKLEEHFSRHYEENLTKGLISLRPDVPTLNLLADLHFIMSIHERVKGWWNRLIQKRNDPICLDLMFSAEWEEIALLLDDASENLERMTASLP
jgi:hypothetical protein